MIQSFNEFCSSTQSLWSVPLQQVWQNPNPVQTQIITFTLLASINLNVAYRYQCKVANFNLDKIQTGWQYYTVSLLGGQEPPQIYLLSKSNTLPGIEFSFLFLIPLYVNHIYLIIKARNLGVTHDCLVPLLDNSS